MIAQILEYLVPANSHMIGIVYGVRSGLNGPGSALPFGSTRFSRAQFSTVSAIGGSMIVAAVCNALTKFAQAGRECCSDDPKFIDQFSAQFRAAPQVARDATRGAVEHCRQICAHRIECLVDVVGLVELASFQQQIDRVCVGTN